MRLILLAAGYGTRLGALGAARPKALLPVGGRPVLDHLVEGLAPLDGVARAHLVTNHRFADRLRGWADGAALPWPVEVLDDGTERPEERMGALGDLRLALERAPGSGPALVAATDNLFSFSPAGILRRARERPDADAVVTVLPEDREERLRRSGVPEVDGGGWVVRFHEKPDEPPADLLAPPLYLFRPGALTALERYLDEGGEVDAPGHFLAWLVGRARVAAWRAPGRRWEVGTPASYRRARRAFEEPEGP